MNIEKLKEMVSDLDEEICRLNLKIQKCVEAGIEGYISISDGGSLIKGLYITDTTNLSLDIANSKINLLDK